MGTIQITCNKYNPRVGLFSMVKDTDGSQSKCDQGSEQYNGNFVSSIVNPSRKLTQ